MKIIKARYDLILFFFLPFSLIATLLYIFYFNQLIQFGKVNWIFSLFLVAFAFFPKAKITFGNKAYSKTKWISGLFISQLLLNLTTWGLGKILTIDPVTNQFMAQFNLVNFSLVSGLFPWAFTILFALTVGYFTYNQKQLGLVSSAYQPFFNNKHTDSIGVAVDSYMRMIFFFVIMFLFTLLAMSLILLMQNYYGFQIAAGLGFKICFISCVLFLFVSHQLWLRFLHQLMYKNIPTVYILLSFTVLLSITFVILNGIANWLVSLNPLLDMTFFTQNSTYTADLILLIIIFWWLALGIMVGGFIAYISRNASMREIIFYSFITNLLSLVIVSLFEQINNHYLPATTFSLIIMVVCTVASICTMLPKENFAYFSRATLPTNEPCKLRSTFRFLKIAPMATVSFLCAYFGGNVNGWGYLVILGFFPPLMIILISFIAFFKAIKGDKKQVALSSSATEN